MKLANDRKFVWVCAYIDAKFLKNVERELDKYPEYKDVEAYIPTVKILKKTFKKENFFEEVPLLFNYGFFKVPRKYAIYRDWLDNMQRNISCIYGWVKDAANVIEEKPRLRMDGQSVYGDKKIASINKKKKTVTFEDGTEAKVPIAVATSEEITRLIKDTINMGAHSADDIDLLREGADIVLRGYPWDGVNAKVLEIDTKKEKVQVEIRMFDQLKKVLVSFDNVFFTIYHNKNYDDSLTITNSIDAMSENKTFDKLQKKNSKDGTES